MSRHVHEAEGGGAGDSREPFTGRPLPLHSKRLTGAVIQQIAQGLEVPATASTAETRQLIEGKLGEMGREARNVQVLLQEREQGTRIGLKDADGIFLDLLPQELEEEPQQTMDDGEGAEGGAEAVPEALQRTLKEITEQRDALQTEVSGLQEALEKERGRARDMWQMNCLQLSEFDAALTAKDEEIAKLREQLARLQPLPHSVSRASSVAHESSGEEDAVAPVRSVRKRRGKAPPVDAFTGENQEVRLDDWLPALQRATEWNGWSQDELLIQLAGHLRGRALQEWNLLGSSERASYDTAVAALRRRLDPGARAMAAQDF